MGWSSTMENNGSRELKSKNLFNYKNQGTIDEQFKEEYESNLAYIDIPELNKEGVEEYRNMINQMLGSMSEMEPYKTCLGNVTQTADIIPAMEGNDYSTPINIIKPKEMTNKSSPVMIHSHGAEILHEIYK